MGLHKREHKSKREKMRMSVRERVRESTRRCEQFEKERDGDCKEERIVESEKEGEHDRNGKC